MEGQTAIRKDGGHGHLAATLAAEVPWALASVVSQAHLCPLGWSPAESVVQPLPPTPAPTAVLPSLPLPGGAPAQLLPLVLPSQCSSHDPAAHSLAPPFNAGLTTILIPPLMPTASSVKQACRGATCRTGRTRPQTSPPHILTPAHTPCACHSKDSPSTSMPRTQATGTSRRRAYRGKINS